MKILIVGLLCNIALGCNQKKISKKSVPHSYKKKNGNKGQKKGGSVSDKKDNLSLQSRDVSVSDLKDQSKIGSGKQNNKQKNDDLKEKYKEYDCKLRIFVMRHGFSDANVQELTQEARKLNAKFKQQDSKHKLSQTFYSIKTSFKDIKKKRGKMTKEDFKLLGAQSKDSLKYGLKSMKHGMSSLSHGIQSKRHAFTMRDPELDFIGFDQCQVARSYLKGNIKIVFCSGLLRSVESAVQTVGVGNDVDKIFVMPYLAEILKKGTAVSNFIPIFKGVDNVASNPKSQKRRMGQNVKLDSSLISKVDYRYVIKKNGKFTKAASMGSKVKFLKFWEEKFAEILSSCNVPLVPGQTIDVLIVTHSIWMNIKLSDGSGENPWNVCIIELPGSYNIISQKIKIKHKVTSFHDKLKNKNGIKIIFEGIKGGGRW